MADGEIIKEIIDGLRCAIGDPMPCAKCRYREYMYSICKRKCAEDAIALLKEQEPRVMTLEDIRVIYHRREDHVWPFDTPPYLWVETNGRTAPYWMSWNNVIACLKGQFPKYDPDDYGKTWCLWTSRPTDEQREAEPWRA